MYYRYELWVDDECQGIGFLQGLDDLGLPDWKVDELVFPFDELLPLPLEVLENGPALSYFTEEGNGYFEEAIRNVIAAYDEDGLFYVECRAVEEIEGDIAYEDTWQVIAWQ